MKTDETTLLGKKGPDELWAAYIYYFSSAGPMNIKGPLSDFAPLECAELRAPADPFFGAEMISTISLTELLAL